MRSSPGSSAESGSAGAWWSAADPGLAGETGFDEASAPGEPGSGRLAAVVVPDVLLPGQLVNGCHDGVGGLAPGRAGFVAPQMAEVQRFAEPDGDLADPRQP